MKKWLIPQFVIDIAEEKAKNSFIGKEPFTRKGFLCLYNKNSNRNYYFKSPVKKENSYAWIAERKNCPDYFKNVILEFKEKEELSTFYVPFLNERLKEVFAKSVVSRLISS